MWFVRDTEPVFIIDTLKTLIDYIVPGNEACKQSFQRKMNEVYTVIMKIIDHSQAMRADPQSSLSECYQVVLNPNLVIASVNRKNEDVN